ncbi:uncharacterized protein EV420DRAFT_1514427 [Desarmillaria tabescens]|uniref:Uncharacterized protein n=1 Tax=Armillaria tabescens TaxID=1929756 RepID=A0AA39NGY3_ARMTA|nr:uncharacterized protein EV420DRAFT_1514427 [Desarmillaria tabescens]KAK0465452.1 hypothetical protein EV420DRAFT_1514427 [Desarmillaria tabescens]
MPIMTTSSPSRSFFVTFIAGALGSIGLGVSVAAIWFIWLVPNAKPAVPELTKAASRKARRRSAPPSLPSSRRQASILRSRSRAALISEPSTPDSTATRHVSFLDSQIRSGNSRRFSVPTEEIKHESDENLPSQSDSSPRSSSSTLVSPQVPIKLILARSSGVAESGDGSAESDSSTRRSSLLSPRLPKMRNPLGGKKRTNEERTSLDSVERPKPVRASSLSTSWQRCRQQTASDILDTPPPPESAGRPPFRRFSGSQSTSYFSFKTTRKPSNPTPAPRTQPYQYPYFATPPTGAKIYIRALPQSEGGSTSSSSSVDSTAVAMPESTRSIERTEANAQAQASLGYGRRPTPKRRAASESWTTGAPP